MSDENVVKVTADAIKGVADAVPIYQDALQPAARQIGRSLETLARTINLALSPLAGLVWGYEQIATFLTRRLEDLLRETPLDEIQSPPMCIAGPLVTGMRFLADEQELREMFARLLAASMVRSHRDAVHPAFVEIIKQLSPEEARYLRYVSGDVPAPIVTVKRVVNDPVTRERVSFPFLRHLVLPTHVAVLGDPSYTTVHIDNLIRLGILAVDYSSSLSHEVYKGIQESAALVDHSILETGDAATNCEIVRGQFSFTRLGWTFVRMCVEDP